MHTRRPSEDALPSVFAALEIALETRNTVNVRIIPREPNIVGFFNDDALGSTVTSLFGVGRFIQDIPNGMPKVLTHILMYFFAHTM